jgi:hypothetical protein
VYLFRRSPYFSIKFVVVQSPPKLLLFRLSSPLVNSSSISISIYIIYTIITLFVQSKKYIWHSHDASHGANLQVDYFKKCGTYVFSFYDLKRHGSISNSNKILILWYFLPCFFFTVYWIYCETKKNNLNNMININSIG